ncbi:MAG: S41 family peptidase [Chitinophagaceae bacterium]
MTRIESFLPTSGLPTNNNKRLKEMRFFLNVLILAFIISSCNVSRSSFRSNHKYSPKEVEYDYRVFENVLKESHPGLYWYTSKDSMDFYFKQGERQLKDSMTEPEFRKVLSYVVSKIDCGHTSVKASKHYFRHLDSTGFKIFPLSLKLWDDTATVAANLNRNDSILRRGTVITGINNRSIKEITDTIFQYLPADGYNRTHKFQTLSNRGTFGASFTSIYGSSDTYTVNYVDSGGALKSITIPVYNPLKDSLNRIPRREFEKTSRHERKLGELLSARQLQMDLSNKTATMDVNTFSRGYRLKRFFRRSFRQLRENNIQYLVIDLRGNGGGNVMNSTLLSKFLIDKPFKLADSLYAISRHNAYSKYVQNYFFNRVFMWFATKKRDDGYYHFGYFERHYFKPKKKNHFDGKTYILIGGNSFSATSLFTESVITEDNVIVVGEETGGGAYGNTAWLIPDVVLPETGVRFRLPLFRLVIDKNNPKNGRGIIPEVEVKPTVEAIRNGKDYKMDKVKELIKEDQEKMKK